MSFKEFLTEAEVPQVPKEVLIYMPGTLATDKTGFKCSGCVHFHAEESICFIMNPKSNKVSKDGVCGMYTPLKGTMSKSALGYVAHATHCASCKFPNTEVTQCARVIGKIEPNGCCNAWEPK
jgi:hypothetical protein